MDLEVTSQGLLVPKNPVNFTKPVPFMTFSCTHSHSALDPDPHISYSQQRSSIPFPSHMCTHTQSETYTFITSHTHEHTQTHDNNRTIIILITHLLSIYYVPRPSQALFNPPYTRHYH